MDGTTWQLSEYSSFPLDYREVQRQEVDSAVGKLTEFLDIEWEAGDIVAICGQDVVL